MATAKGTVKKTSLEAYSRPRASGIIAVDLRDGDRLVDVALTTGSDEVMLFTDAGKVIRFHESDVRPMGRVAAGVRGIRLGASQSVNALIIVGQGTILTATENGYGKRTPIDDYPTHKRGGQGVVSIQTTRRNGPVVGAKAVRDDDELILITEAGMVVRIAVAELRTIGRATQGVRLIGLRDGDKLVSVARVASEGNGAQ